MTTRLAELDGERWLPIVDWPYEVSDRGRVRRSSAACGTRTAKILTLEVSPRGYQRVRLYQTPRAWTPLVHHLVLVAFVGVAPGRVGRGRDDFQANHRDGDKANNTPSNLEWITQLENQHHAAVTGLKRRGAQHHNAVLDPAKIRAIRDLLGRGSRHIDIARSFGVSRSAITAINCGRIWRHIA